nr:uncharacterized protein LOC125633527 [Caretta caretta]
MAPFMLELNIRAPRAHLPAGCGYERLGGDPATSPHPGPGARRDLPWPGQGGAVSAVNPSSPGRVQPLSLRAAGRLRCSLCPQLCVSEARGGGGLRRCLLTTGPAAASCRRPGALTRGRDTRRLPRSACGRHLAVPGVEALRGSASGAAGRGPRAAGSSRSCQDTAYPQMVRTAPQTQTRRSCRAQTRRNHTEGAENRHSLERRDSAGEEEDDNMGQHISQVPDKTEGAMV